jgi:hypothetical protein
MKLSSNICLLIVLILHINLNTFVLSNHVRSKNSVRNKNKHKTSNNNSNSNKFSSKFRNKIKNLIKNQSNQIFHSGVYITSKESTEVSQTTVII